MDKRKKDKVCPKCHVSGFIHDGWTCTGRPQFTCQGCNSSWTCGNKDGKPYYDNALSHPDKIIILGWTQEDYDCYNLSLENGVVRFERK